MSDIREEVKKAIGAHGLWKARLKSAITSGKVDTDPANASKDTLCDFGKWIYSLKVPYTSSPTYNEIKKLHGQFHQTVGKALGFIQAGQVKSAEQLMSPAGEYTLISQKLVDTLMRWSKENESTHASL